MHIDGSSIVSGIAYHPYLALTAGFDLERTTGSTPGPNSTEQFKKQCRLLRDDLLQGSIEYSPHGPPAPFAPYLHRPMCMAALGSSDAWAVTLLDHFVAAARLTSVTAGVDHSEAHLCPRIETLCLETGSAALPQDLADALGSLATPHWPFCEPDALFGTWRGEDEVIPPAGLCLSTLFKSGLLTSIPNGYLLQSAVYTTIVAIVRRAMIGLYTRARSGHEPLYSLQDVLSARCLLLEPLGADDFTLLFFCRNYTIAATAVEVLRTLTIHDAWQSAPSAIEQSLLRSDFHELIVQAHQSPEISKQARLDSILQTIGGNHLFMRSYTTLCFREDFLNSSPDDIGGWCEPRIFIDSHSGHEAEIDECLDEARRQCLSEQTTTLDLAEPYRFLAGIHDAAYELTPRVPKYLPVVLSFAFLRTFITLLIDLKQKRQVQNPLAESSFTHVTSSLLIPVPKVVEAPDSEVGRWFPQGQILRKVDWKSHRFGKNFFSRSREAVKRELGLTNLLEFRDHLRTIGCPSSLQYSILYMCQEFLDCLGDPLRFETVVDLYDSFAALISTLKSGGPIHTGISTVREPWHRRRFIAEMLSSGSFNAYVNALLNAFRLRIETAVSHHGYRDTAFTLRFGVAKLIGASDVTLKCSIGLFRAVRASESVPHQKQAPRDYLHYRGQCGSVTSISHHLHTSAHPCLWSIPKPSALLAIDMDLFHLFRPEQGYYFLHEVAHLFLNNPVPNAADVLSLPSRDADNAAGRENASLRTDEVFADLLASLFVFEHEVDLFSRFHTLSFAVISGRVIQVSRQDEAAFQSCVFEVVLRGFLVTQLQAFLLPDRIPHGERLLKPVPHGDEFQVFGNPDEVARKLKEYSQQFGRDFPDLWPFWEDSTTDLGNKLNRLCQRVAHDIARPEFGFRICGLMNQVIAIWNKYWSTIPAREMSREGRDFDRDVGDGIRKCLQEGRAFLRANWSEGPADDRDSGLECLYVVSRLIREYTRFVLDGVDTDAKVFVGSPLPNRWRNSQHHSPLLMHESHVPFYAAQPRMRSDKLRALIGYLKTLSDISMQLRSRRVVDLGRLANEILAPESTEVANSSSPKPSFPETPEDAVDH